jgi:ubiquinone/menaquinone biosynthesis C-methylase UbiE
MLENLRSYSAPNAAFYDALTGPLLDGFFARVARGLLELSPEGRLLEVGSGPGRLAVRLAQVSPEVLVTGVDIAPEMVEMANTLAARSRVADRVGFVEGDVASLPFADASFDAVVSTFLLHHWPSPAEGLAEIYRVLRPGGVLRIYDVAGWIRRFEREGPGFSKVTGQSPFGANDEWTQKIANRLGPIPLVYQAELIKSEGT